MGLSQSRADPAVPSVRQGVLGVQERAQAALPRVLARLLRAREGPLGRTRSEPAGGRQAACASIPGTVSDGSLLVQAREPQRPERTRARRRALGTRTTRVPSRPGPPCPPGGADRKRGRAASDVIGAGNSCPLWPGTSDEGVTPIPLSDSPPVARNCCHSVTPRCIVSDWEPPPWGGQSQGRPKDPRLTVTESKPRPGSCHVPSAGIIPTTTGTVTVAQRLVPES